MKALADSGRVCQHCGGVLPKCLMKHRAAPRMLMQGSLAPLLALTGYPAVAQPPMPPIGGRVAEVMFNTRVYGRCRFCNVVNPDHPGRPCPMMPLKVINRRPPNAVNVELLRQEVQRREVPPS